MLAAEARSESDSGLVLGIRHGTESGARVEVVAKQGAEASLNVRSESSSELELQVVKSNRRPLSHDPPVECNSEVRFMKSLKTDSELKKGSIRAGTISGPKTNA
jgi:hypothetical protein